MCNLYSMTKNQAAIRNLFKVDHDITGNLPAMPGIAGKFPVLSMSKANSWRMVSWFFVIEYKLHMQRSCRLRARCSPGDVADIRHRLFVESWVKCLAARAVDLAAPDLLSIAGIP